ncbi:glycosyltransferase [Paenisporosarcina sp. FSL H8-0542]|uniref:glycosyltransferase family 2 protein n=1 Tax=Paenisporosarcina sp. FSL H8-0542 TaxID=2921401 RepID=UPI00315A88F2
MDLISIVVPVYNSEKYLFDCIESILNQSYSNIELILVNDGSNDCSLEICQMFVESDNRVKLLSKKNSGVSDTRNLGIKESKGEYITFVDSDDMLKNQAIEIMYEEIKMNQTDLVVCNFEYDYSGIRVKKIARITEGIYSVNSLSDKLIDDGTMSGILFGSVWSCLYKTSIIRDFNIRFVSGVKYNEDGIFNLAYLQKCKIVKVKNEHIYIYRNNEQSVTKMINLMENKFTSANEAIQNLYTNKPNLENQVYKRNVSIAFWRILEVGNSKNNGELKHKIHLISEILTNDDFKNGIRYINPKDLNKYKYVYFYLMKYQQKLSLYLITRYVYPALQKVLVR